MTSTRSTPPAETDREGSREAPTPRLAVHSGSGSDWTGLRGDPTFLYGELEVEPRDPRPTVDVGDRRVDRDRGAEEAALAALAELGLEEVHPDDGLSVRIPGERFLPVVRRLLAAGWRVEAMGARLRRAGSARMRLESRGDGLELTGGVELDGRAVPFPALLRGFRERETSAREGMVRLDDGSIGLLPVRWLRRWERLAALAAGERDGALRFRRSQGLVLDALLPELPEVDFGAAFTRLRDRLDTLRRVSPAPEPRGFRGELRDYQRVGLGWFRRLGELGMGGCLADDMGLGKTVQTLAWLQWRRARPVPREEKRPSLVVAPRSLLFNWAREAERFTPRLTVLEYSGSGRGDLLDRLPDHDLVLTTYDTLRRDAERLERVRFDTVVLDEAQAIKNPDTQRAAACRRLTAEHRFALTGTPVENHLGDLWSIFEFLEPGLLGRLGRKNLENKTPRADEEEIARLARALSPFILRRTKQQVAADLPPKSEQVIHCELTHRERQLYERLRRRFRAELAGRLEEKGLGRSKIHVLEALLRLRQAACHPGLVDPDRAGERSAKVEQLVEQLREVIEEGHKALVFSQFTRLLGIVRRRLEEAGLAYEYLDGRTRDRAARVDRFQRDEACPVFLVSLKAGGVGLNLTAAEYVFLLDPWWNPAVETQAVDRTHRIGQPRPVFAYRLISRDTVEEKVVALQERKRELAEAIVAADESLLRGLTPEDLDVLLG